MSIRFLFHNDWRSAKAQRRGVVQAKQGGIHLGGVNEVREVGGREFGALVVFGRGHGLNVARKYRRGNGK